MLLAAVTFVKAVVSIEANDVQPRNILSTFVTLVKADVSIEANFEQFWNMLLAFVMLAGSLHIPDNLVQLLNKDVAPLVYCAVLKSLQLKSSK